MSKIKNTAALSMKAKGSLGLSEHELLVCLGIPYNAATELLTRANHVLGAIAKMSIIDIAGIKGIGMTKAAAIIAAIELGRRRQVEHAPVRDIIFQSSCIFELLHPQMRDLQHEEFWVILLNRRNKVLRYDRMAQGGISGMVVDPKIIFHYALQHRASSIIMVHNHPSGGTSPSMEDIRLTEKVKIAGTYIDIKVMDHVIIGEGAYYSFADEGKL